MLSKTRAAVGLVLLLVTLAGFGLKFYVGPGSAWANDYGAGVMYEVFWILAAYAVWPSPRTAAAAPVLVFMITSALEFTQLSQAPFLQSVRATFLGRTLIGTDFSWLDFPHYVLGCFLGAIMLKGFRKKENA
jgi:hypothetical protein